MYPATHHYNGISESYETTLEKEQRFLKRPTFIKDLVTEGKKTRDEQGHKRWFLLRIGVRGIRPIAVTTAWVFRLDWCCDLCRMPVLAGSGNQEKRLAVCKSIAIDFVSQFRGKREEWENLLLGRRSRASGSFRSFGFLYWMAWLAWAAEASLRSLGTSLAWRSFLNFRVILVTLGSIRKVVTIRNFSTLALRVSPCCHVHVGLWSSRVRHILVMGRYGLWWAPVGKVNVNVGKLGM